MGKHEEIYARMKLKRVKGKDGKNRMRLGEVVMGR